MLAAQLSTKARRTLTETPLARGHERLVETVRGAGYRFLSKA